MAKILVVDDEEAIRQLIRVSLRGEGYDIVEAADGGDALRLMDTEKADLVILDILMPDMDGWALCEELRRHYDVPLLMLTALGDNAQVVKGFQAGTDDYMTKPFHPNELVLRVKALLRRYRIEVSNQLHVGRLVVDRSLYEVRIGDRRLTMPMKEFELLYQLARGGGQILTRNQLVEQVWGVDFRGDERTVDVHIKRLRERIDETEAGVAIVTVRGLGYRLQVLP
ncbi:response regulator transcription factor [Paenibacillus chartarius]|uniref:Heme response regulator HssR n=1 Tax=Paenibacillus chartarius TaxID=747481 RepID=A0ABV6DEG4_9BACL